MTPRRNSHARSRNSVPAKVLTLALAPKPQKRKRCSGCGDVLPEDITYLEAVRLEHHRPVQWHFFCESCLAKLTKPYETRWDYELQELT